jgi:hypothetical protein
MGQAVQLAPMLNLGSQPATIPEWSLAKRIVDFTGSTNVHSTGSSGAGPCPATCVMSRWSQAADEPMVCCTLESHSLDAPAGHGPAPQPQTSILRKLSDIRMASCARLLTAHLATPCDILESANQGASCPREGTIPPGLLGCTVHQPHFCPS